MFEFFKSKIALNFLYHIPFLAFLIIPAITLLFGGMLIHVKFLSTPLVKTGTCSWKLPWTCYLKRVTLNFAIASTFCLNVQPVSIWICVIICWVVFLSLQCGSWNYYAWFLMTHSWMTEIALFPNHHANCLIISIVLNFSAQYFKRNIWKQYATIMMLILVFGNLSAIKINNLPGAVGT